jgi:hypothetical protein
MNTEAIIEKLLQIQDEQILNTPLDDLNLSPRVYRSLWRSRVRTVRDVADIWTLNRNVRNIGERARCEILGALEAWCLSLPDFTNPAAEDQAETRRDAPGCEPDRRLPIETLHLSQRTYRALKRNRIDTLDDIYRDWDKIASTRNVGTATMSEIQKALHPSGGVGSFASPDGMGLTTPLTGETARLAVDRKDPNRESPPAKNEFADRSTAAGYEPSHEILTKKYVIAEGGVVVRVDLLQAEEPRRPREERWRNVARGQVSATPQDYAPKNTFQAIRKQQDKISRPTRKLKKALDGPGHEFTEWLNVLLKILDKANRSSKVRRLECPLCAAVMKSKRFEKHLVTIHPQAFQEMQNAVSGSAGWQNEEGVGLVFRDPLRENRMVKCPLCEHTARNTLLHIHMQSSHPEVDSRLIMNRFKKLNRSTDYESLSLYKEELNELVKEYERLKQGQA